MSFIHIYIQKPIFIYDHDDGEEDDHDGDGAGDGDESIKCIIPVRYVESPAGKSQLRFSRAVALR